MLEDDPLADPDYKSNQDDQDSSIAAPRRLQHWDEDENSAAPVSESEQEFDIAAGVSEK